MAKNKYALDWATAQQSLDTWYSTSLGQAILEEMSTLLNGMLPDIFGYQGLQIGQISHNIDILQNAGLYKKLVLGATGEVDGVDFGGDAMNLPVATDTMNLVVLPHILEFCEDPHQVLREADRVLSNDGHLLIIGFNPHSLMGVRRYLLNWRRFPWSGEFYSRGRVADWLSVLNFRIIQEQSFFLRFPIANSTLLRRTRFVEKARPVMGKLGAIYIMHARKQMLPMTMVRPPWRRQAAGVSAGNVLTRLQQQHNRDKKTE